MSQGSNEIEAVLFDNYQKAHCATYHFPINAFHLHETSEVCGPLTFLKKYGKTNGCLDDIHVNLLDDLPTKDLREQNVKEVGLSFMEWLEAVHPERYQELRRSEAENEGEGEEVEAETGFEPATLHPWASHGNRKGSEKHQKEQRKKPGNDGGGGELRARAVCFRNSDCMWATYLVRAANFQVDGFRSELQSPARFGHTRTKAIFQQEIFIYTGRPQDEEHVQRGSKDLVLWIDWLAQVDPICWKLKRRNEDPDFDTGKTGRRTKNHAPRYDRRLKRTWSGIFKSLAQCKPQNDDEFEPKELQTPQIPQRDPRIRQQERAREREDNSNLSHQHKKAKLPSGLNGSADFLEAYKGKLDRLLTTREACKSALQKAQEKADLAKAELQEAEEVVREKNQKWLQASQTLKLAKQAVTENETVMEGVWAAFRDI